MLVRIAGLAYQRGFGGHFHNDNSLAVLRDIPGLVVGVPVRASDALDMYETAFLLLKEQRKVVVFVEPIALYHQRDLLEDGDREWLSATAGVLAGEPLGPRVYRPEARDLLIISYGNGLGLSLRAAHTLFTRHGINARVVDLRWLCPLELAPLLPHVLELRSVLVVDECRAAGSLSEELCTRIPEELPAGARRSVDIRRVTSANSFIPLGDAAKLVLLSEEEITEAALSLVTRPATPDC
jgi:2-oxoisovalerate dehydrogenase E1 component